MASFQLNMSKFVTEIVALELSKLKSSIEKDLGEIQTAEKTNFDEVRFYWFHPYPY